MELTITITETEDGRARWAVEGGEEYSIFDGADDADSIHQAMRDATQWIYRNDGGGGQ